MVVDSTPNNGRSNPVEIRHVHLPKLDDSALVAWDSERGVLGPWTRFEETRSLLEFPSTNGQPVHGNEPNQLR